MFDISASHTQELWKGQNYLMIETILQKQFFALHSNLCKYSYTVFKITITLFCQIVRTVLQEQKL